jgi:iron complex outermembrane receptor protein
MKNINYLILICLLNFTSLTYAQQDISGTVSDESGPLPGVSVIEKGTTNGVVTDFDGNFSLSITNSDATLVFSYVGFLSQETSASADLSNIVMIADTDDLDEVIIVGYGTQKREELTSAITNIKSDDFNAGNINDPQQLLQGKVAGLNIARVGGDPNEPFNIRLRGLSTFGANAEPLVIIDGVIGGSLDSVDPADIESVNVLKDASAAAIYGTRGSSGVIILTTKSGKGKEKSGFEYRVYASTEEISNMMQMASYDQFISNGGLDLGSNNNWMDLVSRKASSLVHNLSFNGSGENGLSYRASINYRDVEGVLNTSAYDQINGRISVSQSFLDNKLKFQGNIGVTSREASLGFNNVFGYAQLYNPTAPIYNADGSFYQNQIENNYNPVAINKQTRNDLDKNTFLATFKVDFDITNDLTLSANYSTQYDNSFQGTYFFNDSFWNDGLADNGRAERAYNEEKFNLSEFTATYRGELDNINYELLGGYAYQEFTYQGQYSENTDFLVNSVTYNNLALGLGINNNEAIMTSFKEEAKLASAFARLNLNYQNLLYFSASYRNENSSRFGENFRSGDFWATSVGVNLNSVFNLENVDQLKFRVGYGVTGNEPVERYAYVQKLGAEESLGYINSEFKTAIGPQSNPNPDLKWEEKSELNIGVDFVVLDSKLSGSLDYFNRTTSDLLRNTPVSTPPNIYSSTLLNLGELETKGYEVSLNYDAISKDDFNWSVGLNLSTNETTLINLSDIDDYVTYSGDLGPPGYNGTKVIVLEEGAKLGNIRAGVFAGYNELGEAEVINQETGENTTDKNLDRDGVIVGNAFPDYIFGISQNFKYKKWDLNMLLRGAVGHSIVNVPRVHWEHPLLSGRQNFAVTEYFNPDDSELSAYHSGLVEKGDFIKLDNASLGYNFSLGSDSKIESLRMYISGNNLFTITDYSGSDPEVRYSDFDGDILTPGMDRRTANYLPTRSFTLGLNIKF